MSTSPLNSQTQSSSKEAISADGHPKKRARVDLPDRQTTSESAKTNNPALAPPRPARLEPSLFGTPPVPDIVQAIGRFLFQHVNRPHVEIEAKLGLLVDNQTGQRIRLPVTSLAVLENPSANNSQPGGGSGGGRPTRPWYTFKSDMSLDQHRYFNELLNRRARDTQSSQHRGAKVHYKHTREIDRFYLEPNPNAASQPGEPDRFRIRATFDKETAKVVEGPGAIIEKKKIANLDVYSPNTAMDFRITVSEEKPMRMPTVESSHERHKDRLSYRHEIWQFDLTQVKTPSRENSNQQPSPFAPRGNDAPSVTHELELELANTDWFLKERQRFQDRDPGHQFNTIVQTFVNNIYMLASHAR